MLFPFYFGPVLPPPPKCVVGARYKKRAQTMDWELVEFEADRVVLKGPGYCSGLLYLDRSEFDREWSRV